MPTASRCTPLPKLTRWHACKWRCGKDFRMSIQNPDRPILSARRLKIKARYPAGPWPIELPLDMAAAFFGYETTSAFTAAVHRGDAPQPSASRGARKQPVWSRVACEAFISRRHAIDDPTIENIKDLI
jgi:hypothetical protein